LPNPVFIKQPDAQVIDNNPTKRSMMSKDLTEILIRVGLIAAIVFLSLRVLAPFIGLLLWALILAVALYPLHQMLAKRLGGKQGRAAVALVLLGLVIIGGPTVVLGSSFAEQIHGVYAAFDGGQVTVPPPAESVKSWPIVGEQIYAVWQRAANDLAGFLADLQPQLGNFARHMLQLAASTAGAILIFLGSLIIAGIMMAYGQSGSRAMLKVSERLSGAVAGPRIHRLTVATVRSVATGVIGVAFIQALLLGIGFILAGIPAAGILAAIVLVLGILQLPAALVSLPAIGYLWWTGDHSVPMAVVWTALLLVAGMADNILKPLLLGRGVDVPMPVVLLGALGGMVSGGMIGLFIGAVLLSVGYQLFMDWVDELEAEPAANEAGRSAEADH
jgi:predicted PurR-regulated permease PerM